MQLLKAPDKKYLLIINPMSKMGRGLRRAFWLITRLILRRAYFEAAYTRRPGHAERIVSEFKEEVDVVVAIGGDGTVREVVNGLMKRKKKSTLAVMPAGRGNDFASLIGIGKSKKRALSAILNGKNKEVDLLKFQDRYATNVVGLGYDASVQEKAGRYKYFAVIRYLIAAIILIIKGPVAYPMRIEHAKGSWEGKFFIVIIGHTRKYAKHIRIFPGLEIDGGIMRVAAIPPVNRLMALVILFAAGLGLAGRFRHVLMVDTPWVLVTPEKTTKAQCDGDLFYVGQGETLHVELKRAAITVRVP